MKKRQFIIFSSLVQLPTMYGVWWQHQLVQVIDLAIGGWLSLFLQQKHADHYPGRYLLSDLEIS
jgi:hypothetical protein